MSTAPPGIEDVRAAAARIGSYLHRTPVLTSRSIDAMVGAPVHFKCENFQRSGSFKLRGALAALSANLEAARSRGAATHSSGNHAGALALAGRLLGVSVTAVMPERAPEFKRQSVLRYGARVVGCGPTLADREAALAETCAETDAVVIPPYDHPEVIAGQGTAALELLEQAPDIRAIWVPVGGGGLASGTALVGREAGIPVWAGEPELADDAYRGLLAGRRAPAPDPVTVADGLRGALSDLTFGILRECAVTVVTVPEAEILAAQRVAWNCLKVVIEPSSAVPLAALLRQGAEQPVAVILTGGNLDLPGTERAS